MQSVFTSYYPATNYKGSRIKVWASGNPQKPKWYSYPHEAKNAHMECAKRFIAEMKWNGVWLEGSAGNNGNVYVSNDADSFSV